MGQTLRDALKRAELKPQELARRSGVARSTVYRLIGGDTANPSHDTVRRLEAALGVAPGSLVFGHSVDSLDRPTEGPRESERETSSEGVLS